MIDANVVMICEKPLLTKQRSPYQKYFENSTEKGDGKIGQGEIARFICFQTMVYKETQN
jgi:hypothetical protein